MSHNYTIVTAFFDIGRKDWKTIHARNNEQYLINAKRMLSLDDNMVIYIEEKFHNFVVESRKDKLLKTKIIITNKLDLPMMKFVSKFKEIMDSDEYKKDLADCTVPECSQPLYDVIMFSKTHFLQKTIDENFFGSTHFVWLDFGVHRNMLPCEYLNKKLFANGVDDKIKFLCRSIPQQSDLDITKFYKSHTNRLAGTMFSGSKNNLELLNTYILQEVEECLRLRTIDCDQSLFNVIYLKNPNMFELYFGDWSELITNYYSCSNQAYRKQL